jgi:conjugal transfer pilin signal peptidase TrbI
MKERKPWGPFLLKAAMIAIAFIVLFSWIESNYRIGIDSQAIRCLPDHKYYLVDLSDKAVHRDTIMAYESKGLQPYYEDGTVMAKYVKAIPGDSVRIDVDGVFVNDELVAEGFALSQRLGSDESTFYRSFTVPPGHYLMLAPAPESYDGRYWGLIEEDQIVGSVIPLM